MPTENKSTNKVRVTRLFGAGATVGLTDPKVNMKVRVGIDERWIVGLDAGNGQVSLAPASGGTPTMKAYPHDLACDTGVASYFGWPAGSGSTTFGHGNPPDFGADAQNTMVYTKGGNPVTFSR